jgi:hypothetical protein
MVGWGPDDAPIARKREALLDAQFKDCNSFLKAVDVFLSADLYGNAVIQHGWKKEVRDTLTSGSDFMPISGMQIQQIKRQQVTMFDGPDFDTVDLLDFYPQPGFKDIDKMAWVVVRRFLDLEDVRDLAAQDIFDKVEMARLEREGGGSASVEDDIKSYRTFFRQESGESARIQEHYSRPIEIIEMWGTIPTELTPGDGIRHRVITVANKRYLLRNRPNPFWHGQKPFLNYAPMPDPHYFFSPGKAEIAEKMQIVANRFTNQMLDALDLFIDPAFFYDRNCGLDTRNLYMRPGRFIGIDRPPGDSIMPIIPNLNGVQMGLQQTEMMDRWIQKGTGIVEDTVQGMGGNRQTAREFLGRQESVATRLLLESRLAEEGFIEPLANCFDLLDRQFLELPREIAILGGSAQKDPISGANIPQTKEQLQPSDMEFDYHARAQGSSSRLSKATRQQNMVLLLQAASSNPIVAQAINWVNFFREIFRDFEINDIDELIAPAMNPMLQQQQLMAAGQPAGQSNGGSPMGMPGEPNQVITPGNMANILGTMTSGAPSQ